jgi:two-component system NtrC family response regulator
LKDREGDAVLLCHHFLNQFNEELKRNIRGFTPDALAAINAHPWPGNVRELENRMKRAVIMADGNRLSAADLDLKEVGVPSLNLKQIREEADKRAIRSALATAEGNITQTAKILGVSRPTLYDLVKQYNISL